MKFKIKLPKDAHYVLYTSLSSQMHPLRLKKKNLESGFCLAQPSSSHELEMPIYSREPSWINQIPGCGQLRLLLLLVLHPSLSRFSGPAAHCLPPLPSIPKTLPFSPSRQGYLRLAAAQMAVLPR